MVLRLYNIIAACSKTGKSTYKNYALLFFFSNPTFFLFAFGSIACFMYRDFEFFRGFARTKFFLSFAAQLIEQFQEIR